MAKVLLVNPALGYSDWNADLNRPSPDSVFIRLGLAYLAGALKARGHEVTLADLRTLSGWRDYEAVLKRESPDFVGITMHSVEFSIGVEAAKSAKKVLPDVTVIAGGIHATMFPQQCIDTGVFDYVIQGEGEISLPSLVEDPSKFPKYFWGETPNLDNVPFPERKIWTDYKKRIYSEPFGISKYQFPLPMAEMINVRGCPFNCSFCCGPGEHQLYTKVSNNKRIPNIRGRSVNNVVDEIEMLIAEYGIRSVMFHDDQFITNPKWVKTFINELHERGIVKSGFKWVTSSRADIICRNEKLIGEMAKAGLELLIIGFESFSPRILKWFEKGVKSDHNFKAAEICKKSNVKVWANYILGVRTDTGWHKEDDLLTVAGVLKVDPVHYSPALYTPVPGSKLFNFYKDNDLIEGGYSTVEDLSNRGKLASKVKGLDYPFLENLMVTDMIFSSGTDIKEIMKSYSPEMNDMNEEEYIRTKSIDAAACIIRLFQGGVDQLSSNYRQAIDQANRKSKISENMIQRIIDRSIKVDKVTNKPAGGAIDSKVSVVIPVRDGGEQLKSLLEKIRRQKKVKNIELIVIDSGSTDSSVEISRESGAKIIEIPGEDFNHGGTRQMGVDEATGEFIALTVQDADPSSDYWLYKMVKCLQDNPELSVVSARQMAGTDTDLYSRWNLDRSYRPFGLLDDLKYGLAQGELFDYLPDNVKRGISFVDDVCACYRADVIKDIKFSKIIFAEDIDIGVRMAKTGHRLGFLYTTGVKHWHTEGPDYVLKRYSNGVKSFVTLLGKELPDFESIYISSFDDIRMNCATMYHAVRLALKEWRSDDVLTGMDLKGFLESINDIIIHFPCRYKKSPENEFGHENLKLLLDELGCGVGELNGDNPIRRNHLLVEFGNQVSDLIDFIQENNTSLTIVRDDFTMAIYNIIASSMGNLIGSWIIKLNEDDRQAEARDIEMMLSKGVCYT